jgi:hypothetical protein
MDTPDERLFDEDIRSVEFRIRAEEGRWGLPTPELLSEFKWPRRLLWIAAAPRPSSPDRFYVAIDASGYRAVPPTGSFWDVAAKCLLDVRVRPKGKPGSRVAKVFRTDWNNGTAFYHPYDRVAADSHKREWAPGAKDDPRRRWTADHTVVDYLEEFHGLLNCGDYLGV